MQQLEIHLTFLEIPDMGKSTFKRMIKKKTKDLAFRYLNQKKIDRNGNGREIIYSKLEIHSYLTEESEYINNYERKLLFQLRTKMYFKIKSHFRNMHLDTICDGCRIPESTREHTLGCPSLIEQNQLVTYILRYRDLYGDDTGMNMNV